ASDTRPDCNCPASCDVPRPVGWLCFRGVWSQATSNNRLRPRSYSFGVVLGNNELWFLNYWSAPWRCDECDCRGPYNRRANGPHGRNRSLQSSRWGGDDADGHSILNKCRNKWIRFWYGGSHTHFFDFGRNSRRGNGLSVVPAPRNQAGTLRRLAIPDLRTNGQEAELRVEQAQSLNLG